MPKRRPFSLRHILLQYPQAPQELQVLELSHRGFTVVGFIPAAAVIVAAPEAASLDGLAVAEVGFLMPEDKLSPLMARAPQERQAWVVEFYRDVDAFDARSLVRENGLEIRERLDLLPSHLVVEATPSQAARLADWDEVAYIFPASAELVDGVPVQACAGPVTTIGSIGQSVASVGDGWDGPGQGNADLGYFLGPLPSRLARANAQAEILRALGEWSKYVRVTFSPAPDAIAVRALNIFSAAGSHGDPYAFDGPGRVLAHTFYPSPPNPEPIAGDLHFDDEENWAIGADIDLFTVALHEAGHALGLGHSDQPGTVMYPYYRRLTELTAADIAAIRELYAAAGDEPVTPATPEGPSPSDPPPAPSPDPPPAPPDPPATPKPEDPKPPQPDPPKPQTPPVVAITMPASGPAYNSPSDSVLLAGTASHAGGIARVSWSTPAGSAGTASGTRAWMAGPIPLRSGSNRITVTALATNGLSAAATLNVTYAPAADTVAPSLTILYPAGTSALTYNDTIVVSGLTSDDNGVVAVTWADSLGATGSAAGTIGWATSPIPLREGVNTITIRARDAAGNSGWRSLSITRKQR